MGIYASVLQALGLLDQLAKLAGPAQDIIGQQIISAELPKRARIPREKRGERDG
jgi:hypothetical protein